MIYLKHDIVEYLTVAGVVELVVRDLSLEESADSPVKVKFGADNFLSFSAEGAHRLFGDNLSLTTRPDQNLYFKDFVDDTEYYLVGTTDKYCKKDGLLYNCVTMEYDHASAIQIHEMEFTEI